MERHDVEEGKKNSARLGAHLIFVDESGFMLTSSVRRTWAPVGQTPVIHNHFANDRISGLYRHSCGSYSDGSRDKYLARKQIR
jgi:hypothetical protein